ncbi:MAG: protein kinase [Acidobacteriota bacterium]|nr:protein kinase [Acidobacteriota bacterium]
MNPEQWQKVREIFDDASRQKPAERRRFVNEVCGDDKTLLAEVESLLSSLGSAESFMETPAIAEAADVIEAETKRLESGTCFGHYEIIKQIGAGGMGEVYLAEDKKLDLKVAVKILNEKFSQDESSLYRFIREAKAASALNHPNILVIHEIGETDEARYIVSEFVKGKTLREVLKEKPLTLSEVLDISIQITGALCTAHEAHLIHRDIKPENIMIRPDGYVKVLDFGLAKLVEQKNPSILSLEPSTVRQNQTAKGVIMGTVNYMSPEQAKGERVDERTDIFSLGVVIYEMMAGRTPFAGDSMSETFANLINAEPQPLSRFAANVPDEMQRIVAKMLRKNKDERYQTMMDVLTDSRDLRENLTLDEKLEKSRSPESENATAILQATTGGPNLQTAETQYSFSRQIKRHKSLAAIVSIVLLGSVIALAYYFYAGAKPATGGGKKSIAVLPLKPIGAANRDEIYEVGIADSLIYKLGAMKGFVVRPLSATRKYADINQDPIAAGREQQVDYVLASNYQLAGGKIRVTSQLYNVENGQIEETYKIEKDASDLFKMQDQIAGEVGNILATRFAVASSNPKAVRGTDNEEAYRLYLQAMYLVDKEKPADSQRAIELFDEALALDPNYAKAWAAKARAHCHFAHTGGSSPDAEFAKAKPAIERAFALDNNLAEAHAVLGIIKTDYDWDFAEGEKQFRQAIEFSPNSDIFYRWYANRLVGQGRSDEAITMAKTAIDLNPIYVVHQLYYGRVLYFARRYDDAIKQLERVAEMDSAQPSVYNIRWRCFNKKADYARAYESFMKAQQLSGAKEDVLKNYETLYARNGWQSVLLKFLKTVKAGDANGSAAYTIAALSALAGEREQSLRYLDEAVKNRSLEISNLKGDPSLDSLRDDPRFDVLVKRVGLRQ